MNQRQKVDNKLLELAKEYYVGKRLLVDEEEVVVSAIKVEGNSSSSEMHYRVFAGSSDLKEPNKGHSIHVQVYSEPLGVSSLDWDLTPSELDTWLGSKTREELISLGWE